MLSFYYYFDIFPYQEVSKTLFHWLVQGFMLWLGVPELDYVIHNLYQTLAQTAKEIAQALEV